MLGYTGTWQGHPVTIHGTGMGMPSLSIYVNELIRDYGAKTLIRIGSAGGMQPDGQGPRRGAGDVGHHALHPLARHLPRAELRPHRRFRAAARGLGRGAGDGHPDPCRAASIRPTCSTTNAPT